MFRWLKRAWKMTWDPQDFAPDLKVQILSHEGFEILSHTKDEKIFVSWTQVNQIALYRDSGDQFCVGLELSGPRTLEISENFQGFHVFVDELPKVFPICQRFEEWAAQLLASPRIVIKVSTSKS